MTSVIKTHTYTLRANGSSFTLGDLRDLLDTVKEAPDGTVVRVQSRTGDQRDPGYSTLTVSLS